MFVANSVSPGVIPGALQAPKFANVWRSGAPSPGQLPPNFFVSSSRDSMSMSRFIDLTPCTLPPQKWRSFQVPVLSRPPYLCSACFVLAARLMLCAYLAQCQLRLRSQLGSRHSVLAPLVLATHSPRAPCSARSRCVRFAPLDSDHAECEGV